MPAIAARLNADPARYPVPAKRLITGIVGYFGYICRMLGV
jgi:hypothetical protein